MKQFFCGITLILLSSFFAKGQETPDSKFFIKVVGGYAPIAPGSVATVNTYRQGMFEESGQRFGQGLRVGLGAGYILNENINLGIDVIYHKGAKLNRTITVDNQNHQFTPTNSTVLFDRITNLENTTSYDYTILNFVPHITFRAISKPKYHIYNRVGLIIGLPLKFDYTFQEESSVRIKNYWPPSIYDVTESYSLKHSGSYTKNPSIGFQAAVGVQFRITKNLRFLTEIEASSLVLTPHELALPSFVNITTTVDNKEKKTAKVEDKKPRHHYYEKKGQARFETKENIVNHYQSRVRFTTNSLSLNLGFALRL